MMDTIYNTHNREKIVYIMKNNGFCDGMKLTEYAQIFNHSNGDFVYNFNCDDFLMDYFEMYIDLIQNNYGSYILPEYEQFNDDGAYTISGLFDNERKIINIKN